MPVKSGIMSPESRLYFQEQIEKKINFLAHDCILCYQSRLLMEDAFF